MKSGTILLVQSLGLSRRFRYGAEVSVSRLSVSYRQK
jgi:hypothetical protein